MLFLLHVVVGINGKSMTTSVGNVMMTTTPVDNNKTFKTNNNTTTTTFNAMTAGGDSVQAKNIQPGSLNMMTGVDDPFGSAPFSLPPGLREKAAASLRKTGGGKVYRNFPILTTND